MQTGGCLRPDLERDPVLVISRRMERDGRLTRRMQFSHFANKRDGFPPEAHFVLTHRSQLPKYTSFIKIHALFLETTLKILTRQELTLWNSLLLVSLLGLLGGGDKSNTIKRLSLL